MPRPARAHGTKADPTASIGFEAAARRGSAFLQSEASLHVVSAAKDKDPICSPLDAVAPADHNS